MLEGCPQAALSFGDAAKPCREKVEVPLDLSGDFATWQKPNPRGGKLNAQGATFQHPTDAEDDRPFVRL
jgi:hypothetical protein